MADYERVLKSVHFTPKHELTGHTRHHLNGKQVVDVRKLRIIEDNGQIFLLYFDSNGRQLTDTWHRSIEDAMNQAQLEFNVARDDWLDEPTSCSND